MEKPAIFAWGSYDRSKPRVRLLLAALRRSGALAGEIEIEAWRGVRDKALMGRAQFVRQAFRLLFAYPAGILKLARLPGTSVVLLPYPALPGIFIAAAVARLRGFTLVLDAFLPLHDTIIRDRRMFSPASPVARLIWWAEKAALRLADIVIVDTDQHGDFFACEFDMDRTRFLTVLVGAEPLFRAPSEQLAAGLIPGDGPLVPPVRRW